MIGLENLCPFQCVADHSSAELSRKIRRLLGAIIGKNAKWMCRYKSELRWPCVLETHGMQKPSSACIVPKPELLFSALSVMSFVNIVSIFFQFDIRPRRNFILLAFDLNNDARPYMINAKSTTILCFLLRPVF